MPSSAASSRSLWLALGAAAAEPPPLLYCFQSLSTLPPPAAGSLSGAPPPSQFCRLCMLAGARPAGRKRRRGSVAAAAAAAGGAGDRAGLQAAAFHSLQLSSLLQEVRQARLGCSGGFKQAEWVCRPRLPLSFEDRSLHTLQQPRRALGRLVSCVLMNAQAHFQHPSRLRPSQLLFTCA